MSTNSPLKTSRAQSTAVMAVGAAVAMMVFSIVPATAATAPGGSSPGGSSLCGSRPDLLKQLSKRYNEEPVAVGLTSSGSLIEVLTSDSGSTWTIMVSQPNGPSCLVAAGEGWEELKRIAKGERGA
jgi:hypothetical protein